MTFPLPVLPEIQAKLNTLNAVLSLDRVKTDLTKYPFVVTVTDRLSKRASITELRELPHVTKVQIPRSFTRKLRVRVHRRFAFRRRVLTIRIPVGFSYNAQASTVSFQGGVVASALSYRFSEAVKSSGKPRVRKTVIRVPVGRPPRPSPESVTGYVPHWFIDGLLTELKGLDPVTVFYREYSGLRTPNFEALRRKHRLPVNPHTVHMFRRYDYGYSEERVVHSDPNLSRLRFRSYFTGLGARDFGPPFSMSHNTSQRNKAIDRLKQRAIGETANLSETVATLNKTFDMIGGNARRIAQSVLALKKGNFSKAADLLWRSSSPRYRFPSSRGPTRSKSLATNWLEMQYGWKPLLNDIHYAITALGNLVIQDKSVGSVSASATSVRKESGFLSPNSVGSPPNCGNWNLNIQTTTRFRLRYKVQDHFHAFMSQSGFTNPVSLAWELLPFSFVVDWFLPIGPYLESLDSWGGLILLDGCETTFSRGSMDYSRYYVGQSWPDGIFNPDLSWKQTGSLGEDHILLNRSSLSDFPSLGFPTFKNPFTLGHTLNGLALLKSAFGR